MIAGMRQRRPVAAAGAHHALSAQAGTAGADAPEGTAGRRAVRPGRVIPDRWDPGLGDSSWAVRARLHTRVQWTPSPNPTGAPGRLWLGELDGPAALGPLAGWRLCAHVEAVTVAGACRVEVLAHSGPAGPGASGEYIFRLGRAGDPREFGGDAAARQAFEDLCRGVSADRYRVSQHRGTWWPLSALAGMGEQPP